MARIYKLQKLPGKHLYKFLRGANVRKVNYRLFVWLFAVVRHLHDLRAFYEVQRVAPYKRAP
jgi:hypothetical protein